jgi:hypothetical protein
LLLAIQQARQAIQANPKAPAAYLRLGQAYFNLRWRTAENSWGRTLGELSLMRQYQMVAAFRNAVQLDPDYADAHGRLFDVYSRLTYKDLAIDQLGEEIRCLEEDWTGMRTRKAEDQLRSKIIEDKRKFKESLDRERNNLENQYAVRSATLTPLKKAQLALQLGLAKTATQVLLDTKGEELVREGGQWLEVDLLLATGQLEELHVQLLPPTPADREGVVKNLGQQKYDYYRFLLAAVEGNYAEADQFLAKLDKQTLTDPNLVRGIQRHAILGSEYAGFPGLLNKDLEERLQNQFAHVFGAVPEESAIYPLESLAIARALLDHMPRSGPVVFQMLRRCASLYTFRWLLPGMAQPVNEHRNFLTFRGVLAVEAGDLAKARVWLHQAQGSDKGPGDFYGGRPAAIGYLDLIK